MDCIQLLCLETEEDSAPLKWYRHIEKHKLRDPLKLLVCFFSPFSYF